MMPRPVIIAALLLASVTAAQTITGKVKIPASGATVPARSAEVTITLPQPPTAAELSKRGALQAFVDGQFDQVGEAKLPLGVIEFDNPLVIARDSVTLDGCGAPWMSRKTGTVLVPKDPAKPVIVVRNAVGVTLSDFGLLDGGVGVSIEGSAGALTLHTHLENVAPCGFAVGIRISEPPNTRDGQSAAADVTLARCRFTRCTSGVEINHGQAVNIHLTHGYFYSCDTAVTVNTGGRVSLTDCAGNPVATVERIKSGGGNQMPYVIRNFYSDRTGGAPMPVLIDARGVEGKFIAAVRDYSVSTQQKVDGPWADIQHDNFIAPTGTWARENAVWDINEKTFNAPGSRK